MSFSFFSEQVKFHVKTGVDRRQRMSPSEHDTWKRVTSSRHRRKTAPRPRSRSPTLAKERRPRGTRSQAWLMTWTLAPGLRKATISFVFVFFSHVRTSSRSPRLRPHCYPICEMWKDETGQRLNRLLFCKYPPENCYFDTTPPNFSFSFSFAFPFLAFFTFL